MSDSAPLNKPPNEIDFDSSQAQFKCESLKCPNITNDKECDVYKISGSNCVAYFFVSVYSCSMTVIYRSSVYVLTARRLNLDYALRLPNVPYF